MAAVENIESVASLSSEAGVLSTLIVHPDYVFHFEQLRPVHFSDNENSCIYEAVLILNQHNIKKIDPYNMYEAIQSKESLKKRAVKIDANRIKEFFDMSSYLCRESIEEYQMLCQTILNCAFKREMYVELKRCERLCLDDGDKQDEDLQKKIYGKIDKILSNYSAVEEIPEFKDKIDECWEEVVAKQTGGGGIPFDFCPSLNDYCTIQKGELIVFGAGAKQGKSILLTTVCMDLLKRGLKVLYLDSEISDSQWTARVISNLTAITYRNIVAGNYNEEDMKKIKEAITFIKQHHLVHYYVPQFDSKSVLSIVKSVCHRTGIDVVIVDYLKSSGSSTDAFVTYAEMGNLTDMLKNTIAGDMSLAVISAAQLTSGGKVADSARIVRNASTLVTLSDKTPEEIAQDGGVEQGGRKKLFVAFNRNGAQQTEGEYISMEFQGDIIRYSEAKNKHIPELPY